MSASTTDRNTPKKIANLLYFLVAAATAIPAGVMAAINSSGYAVNGANAAGLVIAGRANEAADNADGALGAIGLNVEPGIFLWENDAVAPVTIASLGRICYVLDNQTVSASPGTYGTIAGIVTEVTSAGIWVDTGGPAVAAAAAAANAGLSVVVANATVPDGDAYVTIQSAVPGVQTLNVWFAATAYAAPADLGTLTATTGTLLAEHTDDALATVVTNAAGLAVLNLDLGADGTVHAMVERNGLVATDSEAITGN